MVTQNNNSKAAASEVQPLACKDDDRGNNDINNNNKSADIESYLRLPPVVDKIQNDTVPPPICVIIVGMAGSGKTSLMAQMQRSLERNESLRRKEQTLATTARDRHCPAPDETVNEPDQVNPDDDDKDDDDKDPPYYCINLDPATLSVPFDVNIDIRDTINYKEVMKQHKLGPNGAIMTSLNLFTTKFDQVIQILEQRAYGNHVNSIQDSHNHLPSPTNPMDYILIDTPGQIEAFTWSASGSIISESLASSFPTVLCFVVDTVRCASSPNTFMSNMLYACSMMYRTRLPLVICFNKTDVVSHEFCMEWMRDYEAFHQALDDVSDSAGFYGSLTRSLSLVLDEFYSNFANACGVSAVTGDGMDEFWQTINKAGRQDFVTDYIEDLKNRIEEQQAKRLAMAQSSVRRLQRDLEQDENSD